MSANKELNKAPRVVKTSWKRDFKMNWRIYLIALPIVIYFFVFNYLPMGGLIMAFENFNPVKGFFGSKWVGLDNFIQFFTAPDFFQILRNTFAISLLGLAVGFPMSIIFALLLNEIHRTFFKKAVQTLSYMPYFVSTVVICGLVIDFVSSNGIITNMLVKLGLERQNLLLNPRYFWGINLLSDLWQGLGYGSIIYIAAISGVSQEQYEAAAIDGAGRLKRAWHVTLPGILPTIVTMLILRCGLIMTVGFEKILLLYNPSIYETADVISTNVQRMGLEKAQYGYSAAVGLFNSLVGTTLLLVSNAISRKYAEHSVI
ncbi:MAG TPA: sugar ABC transporter permease [Clostridiales bacterium]|nr:sugar ABC transporter permease [Clostridiales bacterium]